MAVMLQVGDSVLLLAWNMGMWEAAASCAGEVREPGKTFPKALASESHGSTPKSLACAIAIIKRMFLVPNPKQ